jgi:hypothetical protein
MRYLITWPNRDQQIIEGDSILKALSASARKGELKGSINQAGEDFISDDEYPGEFDLFLKKSGGKLFLKYEHDNG